MLILKHIPDHNLSLTKEPIFKLEMSYKRQLIYNLCKQFERQIANNIKMKPKAFWNYVRFRMKTHPSIGNVEGIDDKVYASDKVQCFKKLFSIVIS